MFYIFLILTCAVNKCKTLRRYRFSSHDKNLTIHLFHIFFTVIKLEIMRWFFLELVGFALLILLNYISFVLFKFFFIFISMIINAQTYSLLVHLIEIVCLNLAAFNCDFRVWGFGIDVGRGMSLFLWLLENIT